MAYVPLRAFCHGGGWRFRVCVMVALRGHGLLGVDVGPGLLQVGRGDYARVAQLAQQGAQLKVGTGNADFEGALRGNDLRADVAHPAGSKAKVAGYVTVGAAGAYQPGQVDSGGVFHVVIVGIQYLNCQSKIA